MSQKGNWFLSSVIERKRLNHASSDKETYHVVLDLKDSGIHYKVGDCLKIIPENNPKIVDRILRILGLGGSEITYDKEGQEHKVEHFLTSLADLSKITKKIMNAIIRGSDSHEIGIENLKEYLEKTDLLTELERYRPTLTAEELGQLLQPLLPRYYSVASSMRAVAEEAHLTVAAVGIASDYLCKDVSLFERRIKIGHHPSPHFGLPESSHDKPIIMIGPGTGIAPFRGFLQDRIAAAASTENWLFFGERTQAYDFYYQEYLQQLETEGRLRLDTAFSRDGREKVYVQHRMYERRKELWEWIDQRSAYLFVCGDKERMAKSVEEMWLRIFTEEGGLSSQAAKEYLHRLKATKRYMRDVY